MSERIRKAILGAAGVIAFAAVASVAIIGKPQPPTNWSDLGDRWANFVYNYQTLITGIIAVGAAYLTIRQMQESDRREDARQKRQLQSDRWREKIAAERFVERLRPRLWALKVSSRDIQSRMEYDAFVHANGGQHLKTGWTVARRNNFLQLLFEVKKLREIISDKTSAEMDFLPHQAEESIEQLRDILDHAKAITEVKKSWGNYIEGEHPPLTYDGEAAAIMVSVIGQAETVLAVLDKWYVQFLDDLGEVPH
ncbi:hypothetical protein HB780_05580 (plasmid) [Rhizobium lusitanum]|uniref:hypothetical protein n=1 Tax=Rhizobium lusitanum TaxID=293958 RepID=UPI0016210F75|nr:hypothetical protein [Rhizobium lusitanum]QND45226.1 hypothetical protein HB780_05580 [Rhizobium lusitanum]